MTEITRLGQSTRMSQIVKHDGIVYLSGLVGVQNETIEEQTADILAQIDAALVTAGSASENMLRVEIWLADMADFAAMNVIYDAWVPRGHQPARACGESKLAAPGFKIEIIVTAAIS